MSNAFEWHKVKVKVKGLIDLDLDDAGWPECLTAQQISTLHFADDWKSACVLEEMLDKAITDGVIEISGLLIDSPDLSDCEDRFIIGKRKIVGSSVDWIAALSHLKINSSCQVRINETWFHVLLLERFNNGWPKLWAYQWHIYGGLYCYKATMLISRLNYAAWRDRPSLPNDSPLLFWLAEVKDTAQPEQAETVPDAGAASQDGTTKPRVGGYGERDAFAIELVEGKPELLSMRPGQIKAELQTASNLFTSGYSDWWRNNPIFEKGTPGRNPK